MKHYVLRFLLVAIVFTVVDAKADPLGGFSLSFNELQFGEDVLEYYNGGLGGAGSGPGPALGLSFTPGLIAVEGDVYGDPDGKAAELDAPEVIMNVSAGFSGLVQFYLGGPIDVAFYDELDGLGNLVGTISSPGSDVVNETLAEFHSAVFSGTTGITRIDQLSLGPPGGPLLVPEPSALLLLATGIGLVCILLRRKTQWSVSRSKSIPRTILGVAFPMSIAIFSTIARADEIPLWMLLTEPDASISVGSLRFSNFGFFGFFPGSPLFFLPENAEEIRYYCENVPDPFCQQTIAPFQRNGDNGLGVNADYETTSFALLTFDVTSSFGLRGMTIAFDVEPFAKPGDLGDTFAEAFLLLPPFNPGFGAHVEACTGEQECPGGDRFVSQTSFFDYNPQTGRLEPVLLSQAHVQTEVFIGDLSFRGVSTSKITHWDSTFSEVPEPAAGLLFACAAGMTLLLTRRIRTDLRH